MPIPRIRTAKWTAAAVAIASSAALLAQGPPPPRPAPAARPRPASFPERPPADPAKVERGKAIYGVHCTFCHGADARGGSGGTNLIRAEVVLSDQDGELIRQVVRAGREGMPKFDLSDAQVSDIAAFIHSFRVGGYDISRMTPETIVVGDAKKGEAYFTQTCGKCHSVTGDLKAIGAQITDPKTLQQTWLMPGSGRGFGPPQPQQPARRRVSPARVKVTPASGPLVEGVLNRIDDFFVTLTDADGRQRTFTRDGNVPKVEIIDPLKPHRDLLAKYTDDDIHNVTAYLVTVK